MKKLIIYILIVIMMIAMFSACMIEGMEKETMAVETEITSTPSVSTTGTAVSDFISSAGEGLASVEAKYEVIDIETDYDMAEAVNIALADDATAIDGEGASEDGNVVTISEAGTYVVSGELSRGQLIVDADKDAQVRLILNNAVIVNNAGSAINIKQAEKVIVTLNDGSENYIEDASIYENADEDEPDAAIYSSDDLSFNGTGTLTVVGNYKHAIKTVDDLVITGGTYVISAVEEGLRGKDSIAIQAGTFKIDVGDGAILANNDSDEDKGWVVIDGGTFDLTSENNGIEGELGVIINGGTFEFNAGQDALHSNGSIRISDGSIEIIAGDDGIHADNGVEIVGGNIDIMECYEGLEGSDVAISGGNINIIARDDGINAAGGSDDENNGGPGDQFNDSGNYFILVSGGDVYVNAGGDGVDSNGDISVIGGTLMVDGPESGGNAAMDMERGSFIVNGGTLIAAGYTGMWVQPTSAQQAVLTIVLDENAAAGQTVTFTDDDGNGIFTVRPTKTYQAVMISSPDIVVGETYKVDIDGEILSVINGIYEQGIGVNHPKSTFNVTIEDMILAVDQNGNETTIS